MTSVLSVAVVATLVCFAVATALATLRLFRGPAAQDRVQAVDFIYVNGMLIVLVLGIRYESTHNGLQAASHERSALAGSGDPKRMQ